VAFPGLSSEPVYQLKLDELIFRNNGILPLQGGHLPEAAALRLAKLIAQLRADPPI